MLVPTDGLNVLEKHDDSVSILLVQLNTFKCDGLCLGTALHHKADANRDPTRPIPTPCMDRTSLRSRTPLMVQFHHLDFDLQERPEK
ncbi:hypothetical protein IEQ34_005975 [Dendrobium chrysotoxum]|uniref:Uncharacterized protein n=1 Tax=Dendrobium chrysotoxum TaxID=161865 RepID=A0AAV7HDA8_DENCH|nr:hypothetical protein IEQ34_005975 [Dendrobium chrysotoxum]